MLKEFREFAMKGNVVDLAIGVIIGAAFGKIIDSLVNDVIMPLIGAITPGGIDFSNYYLPLSTRAAEAAKQGAGYVKVKEAGAVLGFGQFVTVAVNFLIIAFVLFLVVRAINALKTRHHTEAAAAPSPPSKSEVLLQEIRDLLARQAPPPVEPAFTIRKP